jgi:uncharacterized protein
VLIAKLNVSTRVGLQWASFLAVIRVATNPRVLGRSSASAQAWNQVTAWLDYGLILCSTDSDFARFPGLRWQNRSSPNSSP